MKSNKLYIFYFGGTYGTWVDWLISFGHEQLNPLVSDSPIQSDGSSHAHRGLITEKSIYHPIGSAAIIKSTNFDTSGLPLAILKAIPDFGENTVPRNDVINQIARDHMSINIVCEDEDDYDLAFLNGMYKIKNLWRTLITPDSYHKWNPRARSLDDLALWEERELCSIFFDGMFRDIYQSDIPVDDSVLTIKLKEIVNGDVEELVNKIFSYFGFPLKPAAMEVIKREHQKMLSLQTALGEIYVINHVVSAIQANEHINFQPLSLYAESVLQRRLRHLGYEMRCYNVNELPNNTTDLHKLLVL